jgi:uracil-DNA glycosylase family 4
MNSLTKEDKLLKQIKEKIVKCRKCSLYRVRYLPVIGQGSHQARIVLIGEAPGASEDKTGRPFCGQAGKILDELLEAAGLKREEVYICNILKCRPPQNRDPQKEEIAACTPYLEKQLKIIRPKLIGS